MARLMNLVLNVWRQKSPKEPGGFVRYEAKAINDHMSFLEMLDVVNEGLAQKGEAPIAFDHDCREGICGACGIVIQGRAHGGQTRRATCEVRVGDLDGAGEVTLEPFRARAFPLVRDLIVDRSAFDRVIQAGGYVSVRTGSAPEANTLPIAKQRAERALDAAACIGCGACVAACPNASAALFVGAKVSHLAALPQGGAERATRARALVAAADGEGFGACTSLGECHAACPKGIPLDVIAELSREVLRPHDP